MVSKSYTDVILYPLALWLVFIAVAFVAGFTNYSGVSGEILLGNGSLFLALIFGLWVGKRASKAFKYLWVSMLSALILVLIVGFASLILSLVLASYSANFQLYIGQFGSASALMVVQNASIIAWFELSMIAIAGAALAYEFSSKA